MLVSFLQAAEDREVKLVMPSVQSCQVRRTASVAPRLRCQTS
jgi:hypothetical protein